MSTIFLIYMSSASTSPNRFDAKVKNSKLLERTYIHFFEQTANPSAFIMQRKYNEDKIPYQVALWSTHKNGHCKVAI